MSKIIDFAETVLHWKPHEAQKKILQSNAQFLTVAAGRRFGKSEAMAVKAIYESVLDTNKIIFIIAPTYDQATIIFETVLRMLGNSELSKLVKKTKYSPYPLLTFKHGSEIHARSADKPNNLRGRKAHLVILDEAAFIKDSAVYDVIEPMLADYNGKMIKISTPFGKNHFYESYMKGVEGVEGFQSFRFPSYANPYISHEYLEAKKREYGASSLRWRTEYEAEFVDDQNSVFPWKILESIVEEYEIPIAPKKGRIYTMGVDVAKYQDFTVIAVLDVTDDPMRLVYFERFNQHSWKYVIERIIDVYRMYRPKGYIDVTGVGDPIYEELVRKGVALEPFKFHQYSKQQLIDNLRGKIESGHIVLPNIREIVDEFRFFEYKVTDGGYVKMEARYGYHDDVVIAVALATYTRTSFIKSSKIILPDQGLLKGWW